MTAEEIVTERRRLSNEIVILESQKPKLPEVRARHCPQVGIRIDEDGDVFFFIGGAEQRISLAVTGAYEGVANFFAEGAKLFPIKEPA